METKLRKARAVGAAPAPGGWPVVGHAPALISRRLEFLASLPAVGEVVEIKLGPIPAYVVTSPAVAHQLLVPGDRDYDRGRLMEKASVWFGDSLLTSHGASHQQQRRSLRSAFTTEQVAAHVRHVRDSTGRLAASWTAGKELAVDDLMKDLALINTAQSLFSTDLNADNLESIRLYMPALFKSVIFRTVLPSGLERMPTAGNLRFKKAMRSLDDVVDTIIAGRRARSGGDDEPDDLLASLLAARDDQGRELNHRQIRDHVMTMLVAGSESTAAVLSWALYEIFRNPDIARRVREELDTVPAGDALTLEDVSSLTYLSAVVDETLRRYPVPFIMRRTRKPVRLGEVALPAGAEIVYSPYLLHHDPRWFPEPYRFDPDRWISPGPLVKGSYLPFGAGAHVCIGKRMAQAGLVTTLAVICSRWQLEPVAGQRIREVATGTVHPNRMPMIPRSLPADRRQPV